MSFSPQLRPFDMDEYDHEIDDDYLHLNHQVDPGQVTDQILQSEPEFRLIESKSSLSASTSAAGVEDYALAHGLPQNEGSSLDRTESSLSELTPNDRAALYALSQLNLNQLRKRAEGEDTAEGIDAAAGDGASQKEGMIGVVSPVRVADVPLFSNSNSSYPGGDGFEGNARNPLETSNGPNTTAIVVPLGTEDQAGTVKVAAIRQRGTISTTITTVSTPQGTTTTTTVVDTVTGETRQSSTTFAVSNSTAVSATPGMSTSATSTEVGTTADSSSSNLSLLDPRRKLNLEELNTIVAELLKNGRENADLDAVRSAMERYDASTKDWTKYVFWDSNCKYTRNLIATDGKNYSLMLLCWNAERESPIHNHPRCECFVRVVDGSVVEYRYDWPRPDAKPDDLLRLKGLLDCHPGDVTLMNDSLGLHKIVNPQKRGAVTLHLYFPPYQSCKLFLEGTSTCVTGHMCFHTERGCVVQHLE